MSILWWTQASTTWGSCVGSEDCVGTTFCVGETVASCCNFFYEDGSCVLNCSGGLVPDENEICGMRHVYVSDTIQIAYLYSCLPASCMHHVTPLPVIQQLFLYLHSQ